MGELLGIFQVATPDIHTNRMVNIWNAYQCMATFNMSRSASFFESGIGRGLGFRDSNQDLLGFVHMVPARARERILDLAATQLADRRRLSPVPAAHQARQQRHWRRLQRRSALAHHRRLGLSEGDRRLEHSRRAGASTTTSPAPKRRSTSICSAASATRWSGLGRMGLPLIGRADWNDCLNLNCFSDTPGQSFQTTTNKDGKVAESVFIAGLFVHAGRELAAIASRRGLGAEATCYLAEAAKMEQMILRARLGRRVVPARLRRLRRQDRLQGVRGRQDLHRVQRLLRAGRHRPRRRQGRQGPGRRAASIWPPSTASWSSSRPTPATTSELGEISSYPPGYKENAGIFCHVNPWVMIGETRLGHGDQAHDYYTRINPSAREEISDLHRCEPYVYAQMIAGKDAPTFGEAKNSWLTGTAAWNYYAIAQWILGIRPTYDGLEIAPVIPTDWPGFTATRIFRGVTYKIAIERKGDGNCDRA